MNKIEKHIQSNRNQLDSFEPSKGHMDRFRDKLSPASVSFFSRIPYGLKVAAVLVLVAVSSILVYERAQHYYISRQMSDDYIIKGEFGEAQMYYTSLIAQKYSEIDRLNIHDPEQKEILMKELEEMDRLFRFLQKDLQTNPTDERILSAMITHYQLKLEILGQIVLQLEIANNTKSTFKSHENTEI